MDTEDGVGERNTSSRDKEKKEKQQQREQKKNTRRILVNGSASDAEKTQDQTPVAVSTQYHS